MRATNKIIYVQSFLQEPGEGFHLSQKSETLPEITKHFQKSKTLAEITKRVYLKPGIQNPESGILDLKS